MKRLLVCNISKQEIMFGIKRIVHKYRGELVRFTDVSGYKRIQGGYIPSELLHYVQSAIIHTIRIKTMLRLYGEDYMASLNKHLTFVNGEICTYLRAFGDEAKEIQENAFNAETLIGDLSFRQLGVLAGLGHIGKNQMLINDQLGSAFNLGVVLSLLDLRSQNSPSELKCSHCNICLSVCPVHALKEGGYDRCTCKRRKKTLGKDCRIVCIRKCPFNHDKF